MAWLEASLRPHNASFEFFEPVVACLFEAVEVLVQLEDKILFVEAFQTETVWQLEIDVYIEICLRVRESENNRNDREEQGENWDDVLLGPC
jgi:hypothetical protein